MPIAATLFNRVTFAGLLLNLAAVPLMTVVQAAASATVLAEALLPMLAAPCGVVTAWAATALVASAGLVEVAPWLSVRTPSPPWTVSGLYFAAVAALAALPALAGEGPRRRLARRLCFTTVACLGLVILAAPSTWPWWWRADGVLRVIALDVGQGDATLIEFPDGTRWLVDAGGLPWASQYDIGARVVAPALWTRGVGRLATLLLTHGDPDHIGGATAVVDDFRPAVVEGIPVPAHPPMQQLAAHARQRRRPWATVTRGRRMEVAGVEVLIRHPLPPDWERRKVRNDDSVVVELRYGDISVVLPGDIGAAIEQEIGSLFPPARIRLLKAAHHGSATSTSDAWLDGLRPDAVVISCGRDNRYGHPAAAVLERLAARRLPVFRTDRDGQVVVEADGRSVLARTFSGRVATITKTTNGTHEEHDTPTRSRNLVARMRQLKR
jgi:competence protein ComEC